MSTEHNDEFLSFDLDSDLNDNVDDNQLSKEQICAELYEIITDISSELILPTMSLEVSDRCLLFDNHLKKCYVLFDIYDKFISILFDYELDQEHSMENLYKEKLGDIIDKILTHLAVWSVSNSMVICNDRTEFAKTVVITEMPTIRYIWIVLFRGYDLQLKLNDEYSQQYITYIPGKIESLWSECILCYPEIPVVRYTMSMLQESLSTFIYACDEIKEISNDLLIYYKMLLYRASYFASYTTYEQEHDNLVARDSIIDEYNNVYKQNDSPDKISYCISMTGLIDIISYIHGLGTWIHNNTKHLKDDLNIQDEMFIHTDHTGEQSNVLNSETCIFFCDVLIKYINRLVEADRQIVDKYVYKILSETSLKPGESLRYDPPNYIYDRTTNLVMRSTRGDRAFVGMTTFSGKNVLEILKIIKTKFMNNIKSRTQYPEIDNDTNIKQSAQLSREESLVIIAIVDSFIYSIPPNFKFSDKHVIMSYNYTMHKVKINSGIVPFITEYMNKFVLLYNKKYFSIGNTVQSIIAFIMYAHKLNNISPCFSVLADALLKRSDQHIFVNLSVGTTRHIFSQGKIKAFV